MDVADSFPDTDDASAEERRRRALRRLEQLKLEQGARTWRDLDEWLAERPECIESAPDLYESIMEERRRRRAAVPKERIL